MAWIYLLIAGVLEVLWAFGLKMSHGASDILINTLTFLGMNLSVFFLYLALKNIPLGTGYAVWTGIGTVGTVILGIVLFKEPASLLRIICILMIFGGIIGLKALST